MNPLIIMLQYKGVAVGERRKESSTTIIPNTVSWIVVVKPTMSDKA